MAGFALLLQNRRDVPGEGHVRLLSRRRTREHEEHPTSQQAGASVPPEPITACGLLHLFSPDLSQPVEQAFSRASQACRPASQQTPEPLPYRTSTVR